MSELPEGWDWAELRELAAVEPRSITDGPFGSNLKTSHYTENGPRVVRLQNIGDGRFIDDRAHIASEHYDRLRSHAVEPGDVLVAALGKELPRACIAPQWLGPAIVKADCIRFRPGPNVDGRFVAHMLNSPPVRRSVADIVHGVGRPRLNLREIKAIKLPLPSLDKQQRIVEVIEEQFSRLEAGVESLQRAKRNLGRMREAVLAAAVEGRIAGSNANWIPTTIAELATRIDYGTSTKATTNPIGGIGVLRMGNIQSGRVDLADIKYLPADHPDVLRLSLSEGDLLFNRTNSAELVGKSAVVSTLEAGMTFASYLIRVRLKELANPHYVAHAINSRHGRSYISAVRSQQVGQANVNASKLSALPLALPPIEDQRVIVAEVDRQFSIIDSMRSAIDFALKRAGYLRQAILSKAFSGRLAYQNA